MIAQADTRADLFGALKRQPADALLGLIGLGPTPRQDRPRRGGLRLTREAVLALRTSHGSDMAETGRITIAGLRGDTMARFVAAIAPHLQR